MRLVAHIATPDPDYMRYDSDESLENPTFSLEDAKRFADAIADACDKMGLAVEVVAYAATDDDLTPVEQME